MKDGDQVQNFWDGDPCPVHGSASRKVYHFGSSMTGETDVCMFKGCACAVSIKHDPVGTYPSVAMYHTSYSSAAGRGRFHALLCAAKYR